MEQTEKIIAGCPSEVSLYQKALLDTEMYTESVGDYILPDYDPEIRKILAVRTVLLDGERYETDGRVNCTGTLSHRVIYTDGEGKPSSVELNADYDYALPLAEEGVPLSISAEERVVTVLPRLSGPRKLAVKTKLHTHVVALSEGEMPAAWQGSLEAPEVLFSETVAADRYTGSDEYTYVADIRVPTKNTDDIRILSAEGACMMTEARAENDAVSVRGEVSIACLIDDGGTAFSATARIPVEEAVPLFGAAFGSFATADGRVTKVSCEVSSDGEGGAVIAATVELLITVFAGKNRTVPIAVDAFSPTHLLETETAEVSMTELRAMTMGSFPITGNISRAESDSEDATAVVAVYASPETGSVSAEKGLLVFSGECRVTAVLASTAGERVFYSSSVFTLPYRGTVECPSLSGHESIAGGVRLYDCRLVLDSDRLVFDATATFYATAVARRGEAVLSSLSPAGERDKDAGARILAVYPETGDTLWSIAKRHGVSPRSLVRVNRLPEETLLSPAGADSLGGATRLLIVK